MRVADILRQRSTLLLGTAAFSVLGCFVLLRCSAGVSGAEMSFQLSVKGARIDVLVGGGELAVSEEQLKRWVQNAAEAVGTYDGRFPVPHLQLRIEPAAGNRIRGGMTFPRDGGLIIIHVGSQTTESELSSDWMLTHEMVHLSFPSVPDQNHWIEEGIATYVEPIARIQAGQMDASEMWRDLVRDLPKGLPARGDKGLDHTHTWGRTYWGGALFCFLADVEIRRQTRNAKGLQDALRGILDAGGDIRRDWELRDALAAGDRATGVRVLANLYESMRDKSVDVDLNALWNQLGVKSENGKITLADDAPLAAIRRSITSRRSGEGHESPQAGILTEARECPRQSALASLLPH